MLHGHLPEAMIDLDLAQAPGPDQRRGRSRLLQLADELRSPAERPRDRRAGPLQQPTPASRPPAAAGRPARTGADRVLHRRRFVAPSPRIAAGAAAAGGRDHRCGGPARIPGDPAVGPRSLPPMPEPAGGRLARRPAPARRTWCCSMPTGSWAIRCGCARWWPRRWTAPCAAATPTCGPWSSWRSGARPGALGGADAEARVLARWFDQANALNGNTIRYWADTMGRELALARGD